MAQLPFQVGSPLPTNEEQGSMEILTKATIAESGTKSIVCYGHTQELFMMQNSWNAWMSP